ncbi:Signal transduction histidine kinase [Thermoactinomyces sp. DSM 45891]|uniref:sensor histidine kinase n=1 Tax=Thermoactinomyces sp. DSM 45891 TaxID=1761907 RepID=UPI000922B11F|nr:sensor histidine kinase [Thermoactinomyces sp. DSM 45891]SFX07808.1 Signal transduction histidine kinase [Thermoactinomyces sp. DSM 45891]
MRLFFREHIPLLAFYFIQMALFPLLYWLDGYKQLPIIFYSMGLSLFFLTTYLFQRFISHKTFYRRMSQTMDALDDAMQKSGDSPLPEALDYLMERQFQCYQDEIIHYKKKLQDHITFINQWVHQMKTPISVIHLTIQDGDNEQSKSIQEELDRLRKGLDMVLYASRLDEFEHDFHVKPISLAPLVKKVIAENRRLFFRNKVYPDIQVPDDLTVYSDEKWLAFILNQLLTNAVRYSAGKGQKITFQGKQAGNYVALEVCDHGIGIPKQDLRRVFDPYFTGEHGREYQESTGMGLYLVREICKKLNHRVIIESEVGVGTTVRLSFDHV